MILAQIQRPRGVLYVLYAGDFTGAKAWVRLHYGEAPARYSAARWKTPAEAEYWTSKDQGTSAFVPEVVGPVAMKFAAETLL